MSLCTVRTITDKPRGVDRATQKRLQRIAPDKLAEARERARRRLRDGLPKRINALAKEWSGLTKQAKGIGGR